MGMTGSRRRSGAGDVAVTQWDWDTQPWADAEADDSDKRGKRAERRGMTDLNAASSRLHDAISRLETVLTAERKAAAETAGALATAEDALSNKTAELSAMAAAAAAAEAAVEADREVTGAAVAEAQRELASVRAELAEMTQTAAAAQEGAAEIDGLKSSLTEAQERKYQRMLDQR